MKRIAVHTNLRELRANAGLSLTAAANLTGVSKAMLGQIERQESSPTLDTLWKLAKGFQIPLTALIRAPEGANEDSTFRFTDELTVKTMLPFDKDLGTESFLLTLPAGHKHISEPHEAGVSEDIFALTGPIEVFTNGEWQKIAAQTAIRIPADQRHGYRNPSKIPLQFLNVIYYAGPPAKE